MGSRGRMSRTAVAEVLQREYEAEAEVPHARRPRALPEAGQLTPLYAAAILKISLALRQLQPEQSPEQSIDQLLDQVLEGLPVDRQAFHRYLKANFALVKRAASP